MEWISHGLTGALVGDVILPPDDRPRHAEAWWLTAALAPDWLGFIVHRWGEAHRGVMHSLYALPLLALMFALAARRWGGNSKARLGRLWMVFAAVIVSHLALDALTCYRYNPAWPFVRTDWSLGILPMFDIYIFAGWLILAAIRRRRWRLQSTAAFGLAVFAVCTLARGAGKIRADLYARSSLSMTDPAAEVQSVPDYFRPWIWYIRATAGPDNWRAFNVVEARVVDEIAPSDPRRLGLGFGGL